MVFDQFNSDFLKIFPINSMHYSKVNKQAYRCPSAAKPESEDIAFYIKIQHTHQTIEKTHIKKRRKSEKNTKDFLLRS